MMQTAAGSRNETVVDVVARAIALGLDAARVARRSAPSLLTLPRVDLGKLPLPSVAAPCEVPPPCWWPRSAGEVTSIVCEGALATLRVRVTNCGPVARDFTIEVPEGVSANPPKLSVGPMDRATVTLQRQGAGEALVWVRGCYDHYLRWTVTTSKLSLSSCHEVEIEDCPDYRHHWYDHFYCDRPCPADARR
jgi:hypothetical protein